MRPPESFIGQPIRSLQTMLQWIAANENLQTRMIPDGIYGPETVHTVSQFQRLHGLPITGVTNQATWDAIVSCFETALVNQGPAASLNILIRPGQIVHPGEETANLYLVQSMLHIIGKAYSCLDCSTMNGLLDRSTADALTSFQMLSGLPITGCLDLMTWKHIALHYPLASILHDRQVVSPQPPQAVPRLPDSLPSESM